jgi:dienelactone hydrolase
MRPITLTTLLAAALFTTGPLIADTKITPVKPTDTRPATPKPAATQSAEAAALWQRIEPFFTPPAEFQGQLAKSRSPLLFNDGSTVKSPDDWKRRRKEILDDWHKLMGPWPALLADPTVEILKTEQRGGGENFTQHTVNVQIHANHSVKGYLLVPPGEGPFPAVLTVFYEPESAIGAKPTKVDFGLQLVRRGFVTLNIGSPPNNARNPEVPDANWQPLSYLAYVAANCHTVLANRKDVDPKRIGIIGHSYGGKWAMFASCLYDKFAAAVWCDPDIVFDEEKSNANYWEPWYLGADPPGPDGKPAVKRKPGIPSEKNPRTGAYKIMMETNRDLTELHALMAPRPFLVSGGAEDPPERWKALNHAIDLNKLLGHTNRIAMTNRPTHGPDPEANRQLCDFFEYFLKANPQALNPPPKKQ